MNYHAPCHVYRYFDADGRALYVGLTRDLIVRDDQHSKNSPWHASAVRCEASGPMARIEAMAMEAQDIFDLQPIHNHVHKKSPKLSRDCIGALVAYRERFAS